MKTLRLFTLALLLLSMLGVQAKKGPGGGGSGVYVQFHTVNDIAVADDEVNSGIFHFFANLFFSAATTTVVHQVPAGYQMRFLGFGLGVRTVTTLDCDFRLVGGNVGDTSWGYIRTGSGAGNTSCDEENDPDSQGDLDAVGDSCWIRGPASDIELGSATTPYVTIDVHDDGDCTAAQALTVLGQWRMEKE